MQGMNLQSKEIKSNKRLTWPEAFKSPDPLTYRVVQGRVRGLGTILILACILTPPLGEPFSNDPQPLEALRSQPLTEKCPQPSSPKP